MLKYHLWKIKLRNILFGLYFFDGTLTFDRYENSSFCYYTKFRFKFYGKMSILYIWLTIFNTVCCIKRETFSMLIFSPCSFQRMFTNSFACQPKPLNQSRKIYCRYKHIAAKSMLHKVFFSVLLYC